MVVERAELRATWRATTERLAQRLERAFAQLVALCGQENLDDRPPSGAWTAHEVLDHVVRTDHFLLRLIDKLGTTSAKRAQRGDPWPTRAPDFDSIEAIASHELRWTHPQHMTPTGDRSSGDLAHSLVDDARHALAWLERLPEGEGTLHRIRMSVVPRADDRLDLYEYVLVLTVHAERHLRQARRALHHREA